LYETGEPFARLIRIRALEQQQARGLLAVLPAETSFEMWNLALRVLVPVDETTLLCEPLS